MNPYKILSIVMIWLALAVIYFIMALGHKEPLSVITFWVAMIASAATIIACSVIAAIFWAANELWDRGEDYKYSRHKHHSDEPEMGDD